MPVETSSVESPDSEVIGFRASFEGRSPLDELLREGARRMLQSAIEAEVDDFIVGHAQRTDDQGRRLVVRNGSLPEREILTGAGKLVVRQPRVRDKSPDAGDRVTFSPNVLPPYLKRTESIEELIPWLYLKGISTGDFSEALQALVGDAAKGLSANVVVRLKEQWSHDYEEWSQRDLSSKEYVYLWADGIHVNVRLEDDANKRQCILVLMGATPDGRKELIAILDGYRESEQSWTELLLLLSEVVCCELSHFANCTSEEWNPSGALSWIDVLRSASRRCLRSVKFLRRSFGECPNACKSSFNRLPIC